MSGVETAVFSVTAILVLIAMGFHVAIVLGVVSLVGVWLVRDSFDVALNLLVLAGRDAVAGEIFAVIPLFVLMGLLVAVSDIGRDSYALASRVFGRIRGGLGMATVGANAVFAAITGISLASAAVFSRIAVPEMLRMGYGRRFSVGVVAGSSVLGMLIPPSVLMILYAFVTEQSVGAMFLAGIVPGLLLTAAFVLSIALMARYWPGFVGGPENAATTEDAGPSTLALVVRLGPAAGLIMLVLGGIYLGAFTATEAGAVGALALLVLTTVQRRLTWKRLWSIMVESGQISASILFLVVCSSMYSRLLGISGLPTQIGNWIGGADLSLTLILLVYVLIILVLGFLLDAASIILVVVPLFLPVLAPHDVSLIWFGIVTIIAVEVGLLTPPLGLSCFVIHAALDDDRVSLLDIFAGAMPFAAVMLAVLALVMAFPALSLILL